MQNLKSLVVRNRSLLSVLAAVFSAFLVLVAAEQVKAQGTGDLLMTTYPSTDFTGTPITSGPVTIIDQTNLNPGGRGNYFSVRVEGYIFAETSGTYTFETRGDDGVRLYVDGSLVVNDYGLHGARNRTGTIDLVAGTWYPILLEHYEWGGRQRLRLRYQPPGAGSMAFPATTVLSRSLPVSATIPMLATQEGRIAHIVTEEAARALRTEMGVNQRANRDARARHATALRCRELREDGVAEDTLATCADDAGRKSAPLQFNSTVSANSASSKVAGDFFGSWDAGNTRTLYFGDFDVTRYEGGDVAAVFSARYAREKMIDDRLVGLFLGFNLNHSHIEDVVGGDRSGFGVSAGAYVVDKLTDTLTWDGFVSVGAGRNNLDIRDGSDEISGDYNTTSVLLGVALSGSREFETFELRPEVNLSVGHTAIGNVDLSGGTSDIVDAGGVTLGRMSFEPDFVFALGTSGTRFDTNEFWVTPSMTCEYQDAMETREECGGGLALEWSASAGNGLHDLSLRLSHETIGGSARDSVGFEIKSVF